MWRNTPMEYEPVSCTLQKQITSAFTATKKLKITRFKLL